MKTQTTVKNSKHIKHPLPGVYSPSDNYFKVKSSASYMASVNQIQKKLAKIEKDTVVSKARNYGTNVMKNQSVTVVGLQKTISKVLNIGLYFQQKGHKIEISTKTVKALDEFEGEEESEFRKRPIAGVEMKIFAVVM